MLLSPAASASAAQAAAAAAADVKAELIIHVERIAWALRAQNPQTHTVLLVFLRVYVLYIVWVLCFQDRERERLAGVL